MIISKAESLKSTLSVPPQFKQPETSNTDFDSMLDNRVTGKQNKDDSPSDGKLKDQTKNKPDNKPATAIPLPPVQIQIMTGLSPLTLQALTSSQLSQSNNTPADAGTKNTDKSFSDSIDATQAAQTTQTQTDAKLAAAIQDAQVSTGQAIKNLNLNIGNNAPTDKQFQPQINVKTAPANTQAPATSASKKIDNAAGDILSVEVSSTDDAPVPVPQTPNTNNANQTSSTDKTGAATISANTTQNPIVQANSAGGANNAHSQNSGQGDSSQGDVAANIETANNNSNSPKIDTGNNQAVTFDSKVESAVQRNADPKTDSPSASQTLTSTIASTATVKDSPVSVQSKESVSAPEVIDQLAANVKPNTTEIKMVLNPENLGLLQLKISTSNGHVAASITASSDEVKQALEQHLPQLHAALAEQGLKVSHVSVESQTSQFSQFSFMNDGDGSAKQNQAQQKIQFSTSQTGVVADQPVDLPNRPAGISSDHSLNLIA